MFNFSEIRRRTKLNKLNASLAKYVLLALYRSFMTFDLFRYVKEYFL